MKAVHPHVRGEEPAGPVVHPREPGSPPRAWGRGGGRPPLRGERRFTPTCVGKSALGLTGTTIWAVHPHVRGEEARNSRSASSAPGSPPRAWGRVDNPIGSLVKERFTPTCVGKRLDQLEWHVTR